LFDILPHKAIIYGVHMNALCQ